MPGNGEMQPNNNKKGMNKTPSKNMQGNNRSQTVSKINDKKNATI